MKKFYSNIVDPEIDNYILSLYANQNEIFKEMEIHAEKNDFPIVGPAVGRFLSQLCLIKNPKNVFELGSGFGYSALWFAISMQKDSRITCTDYSQEDLQLAKNYFLRANELEKLTCLSGNSLKILRKTSEKFDIIFNDIDKEYYPDVIDIAFDRLNSGGIFISDNVLWYGRVVKDDNLPSTNGIKEFNKLLFSKKGFVSTLIPLRDGISISIKI